MARKAAGPTAREPSEEEKGKRIAWAKTLLRTATLAEKAAISLQEAIREDVLSDRDLMWQAWQQAKVLLVDALRTGFPEVKLEVPPMAATYTWKWVGPNAGAGTVWVKEAVANFPPKTKRKAKARRG